MFMISKENAFDSEYFSLTVCATYRFLTLIVCGIICLCLGAGIFQLRVTIDPVELWAAPLSQSRIEKEYFDKHFQPFYRAQQVIIKAVDLPPVCISH